MDVEELRRQYRPPVVTTLFVGESPPAQGTFFYLGNSNLATYTWRAVEPLDDRRRGASEFLSDFRSRGFYLVDLCAEPVNGLERTQRAAARDRGVAPLSLQMRELQPWAVVVVMKRIVSHVRSAAALAGLSQVPLFELPFPANGNQTRYVEELKELLPDLPAAGSGATGRPEKGLES